MKRVLVASFVCALGGLVFGATSVLPDPLILQNGEPVRSVELWKTKRRPEILDLFRANVYGRAPVGRPEHLSFRMTDTEPTRFLTSSPATNAWDGHARRKLVTIAYAGSGGTGEIHLVLFVPSAARKPVPCFLLICNRGKENIDPTRKVKSPFWPAEQIVARGYAAAAFLNEDVALDKYDGFTSGVHRIFAPADGRQPDSWGTIAAWSWGASRVMDYLVTDTAIDPHRVAIVGHSRGGKAALWAGAEDERFAMVVSNESGSTGAALARTKGGEHIRDINTHFPHWFCGNYKQFNDREQELPVDQHMLLALTAPRLLYVASASEDAWSDPKAEFRSAVEAGPVYRLLGCNGLPTAEMPVPEKPLAGGCVGYHVRTGKHNLTEYDWDQFMNFAQSHGW